MEKFIFLPHTADIKFKAYGKTFAEALENSVLAVSKILAGENSIKPKKGIKIEVHGSDKENLFYNLVEEIVSFLDTENFITARAEIQVLGNNLKATIYGDDAENYKGLENIKSPTYAEIQVKETKEHGWEIQMVVDV
jgi:SHS2 domain-containing protein